MQTHLILIVGIIAFLPARTFAKDLETIGGRKLTGITVSRAEPDGLIVMTDSGIEKIPFTDLPENVQKEYKYDPEAAATFQRVRATADTLR